MAEERELFTETYDTDPDTVWHAVKGALATMELREADDDARTARFSSYVSLTSWGEHLIASVAPDGSGTVLTVRGRPKGVFPTTKWGEAQLARGVRKDLLGAVARQFAP